ncbi:MAG: hypothetical protein ACYCPP_03970 [Nitrososphaerales archaeon]
MVSVTVTRVAGIAILVAALLGIYIGAYDKLLSQYEPLHWYLNWLIVAVTLVAGVLLIAIPRNIMLVTLSGIVWPIVYAISLGIDVATKLCLGGSSLNCWPSKTDAFQYLILNNPNIPGGYGWQLWSGTMPIIIVMMLIAFVISIISVGSLKKGKVSKHETTTTTTTTSTSHSTPSKPSDQP